jgi:hypothetical protein
MKDLARPDAARDVATLIASLATRHEKAVLV